MSEEDELDAGLSGAMREALREMGSEPRARWRVGKRHPTFRALEVRGLAARQGLDEDERPTYRLTSKGEAEAARLREPRRHNLPGALFREDLRDVPEGLFDDDE